MRFLFASDSFKGTLSSEQTSALLARAAEEVFPGACECSGVPVADGGEGTTKAVIDAMQGSLEQVKVQGPLGTPVIAEYGRIDDAHAILEMASASGLPLLSEEERNPERASSYGTGELIRAALDAGYRDISIAIGGSATNDGGMGCMRALGVRFLAANGRELDGTGASLGQVASIDDSGLDPRVQETKFTVMCDVTNPLCGKDGATWTFGRQKGADEAMQTRLEAGMCNYRDVLQKTYGINADEVPGSGAAGGLGAALLVFLKAELKSGIETVLELIHFDERLEGVSLVVTGEGRTDWQSCFGKVLYGVGTHCKRKGIPAIAVVGGMGQGAEQIFDHGIVSMITTINGVMPLAEALEQAEDLYYSAAVRMFRMLKAGMEMKG